MFCRLRSTGVKESVIKDLTDKGLIVKNATCPYVTNIQLKVKKCYEQGYKIIIVGDAKSPQKLLELMAGVMILL